MNVDVRYLYSALTVRLECDFPIAIFILAGAFQILSGFLDRISMLPRTCRSVVLIFFLGRQHP